MSTSDGNPDQAEEAAEHCRRFEGRNLRIGPERKVHRIKFTVENGLRQPTPVCGQPVSRYQLSHWEPVDIPVNCEKCLARDQNPQLDLLDLLPD